MFERVVELKVGETEIIGLDIAFEIEKDLTTEPNPCHVDIFNLCPENRTTLSKYKRVPVVLKAGYKDSVGVIFKGDMVRCNHIKEEASWKTTLSCGDGATAIQTKRTNKSYAKGTPVKTVVGDLAKQLHLPPGNADNQLSKLNAALGRSLSISTSPMMAISHILRGQNMNASVQNGILQILKKGAALQKEAVSLSAESGLMSSPEIGKKGEVVIKARLMPEFAPGRLVHIDSAMYKGFVVIQKARFAGANFGEEWECELECKAR